MYSMFHTVNLSLHDCVRFSQIRSQYKYNLLDCCNRGIASCIMAQAFYQIHTT